MQSGEIRLAVDIGGTFTDVALESGTSLHTAKTLTTYDAPEHGVLTGVRDVLERAGLRTSGRHDRHLWHDAGHQSVD